MLLVLRPRPPCRRVERRTESDERKRCARASKNVAMMQIRTLLGLFCLALAACGGGGGTTTSSAVAVAPTASTPAIAAASPVASAAAASPPSADARLTLPAGFTMSVVANVASARELAFLPNGDLLVGTDGDSVSIVPNADAAGIAGVAKAFATVGDAPAAGVAYGAGNVYVASQTTLWRIPYVTGATSGAATKIASYRQGPIAPNSDGDVHRTASVAVGTSQLFVSVGSSCNACVEADPTRATVQRLALDGGGMTTYATRIRNAMALAVDPATDVLWAGGAGQDSLPSGHPYEYFDAVGTHAAVVDYGWPACEENRTAYVGGSDCSNVAVPRVEFPAYSTLVGAAFYPTTASGPYAFPAAYRGGVFVTSHGSWHVIAGHHVPPRVAFVALSGDSPATAVDWSNPSAQWSEFVGGFQQNANGDERIGRPTGITVGPNGSLFVADDQTGNIYRIRP